MNMQDAFKAQELADGIARVVEGQSINMGVAAIETIMVRIIMMLPHENRESAYLGVEAIARDLCGMIDCHFDRPSPEMH